jgi:TrmH family RNA methyltransferase
MNIDEFSSLRAIGPHNPVIVNTLALINNKVPNPRKLAFIEGSWAIERAMGGMVEFHTAFVSPSLLNNEHTAALATRIIKQSAHSYTLSVKTFERLSERDNPSGIAALAYLRLSSLEALLPHEYPIVVVGDGIEIPGNIGTILRSLDGIGCGALLLCNRRARVTHPKVVRASQGACFYVPIIDAAAKEIQSWLQAHDYENVICDTRSTLSCFDYMPTKRSAIIVGSERYGVSKEWYDVAHKSISIPMNGKCDSLNVGVVASIVLYQIFNRIGHFS